jgi:hypothetical protein
MATENLALHCAIIKSDIEDKEQKLVHYLVKAMPASLTTKSLSGMTPLLLSFAKQDVLMSKMLIEAGADVYARDAGANNILHLLFVPENPTSQSSRAPRLTKVLLDSLPSFLDILSPQQQEDLLLQRNSYSKGARTPLHHWLFKTCARQASSNGERAEDIFRALLKHAKGPELKMVDGSGETLAHTLVNHQQTRLLKVLLEFQPQALLRENAVGRTPWDLAQDKWLAGQVGSAPELSKLEQLLIHRRPESFRSKEKTNDGSEGEFDEIWKLCQAHVEECPGKRVLVSLNEANEVARRLAKIRAESGSSQRWQNTEPDYDNEIDDKKPYDEVSGFAESCEIRVEWNE